MGSIRAVNPPKPFPPIKSESKPSQGKDDDDDEYDEYRSDPVEAEEVPKKHNNLFPQEKPEVRQFFYGSNATQKTSRSPPINTTRSSGNSIRYCLKQVFFLYLIIIQDSYQCVT